MSEGIVRGVGPKVKAKLKLGSKIAFSGRWDDAENATTLPRNYQMIREGDVGGVFA